MGMLNHHFAAAALSAQSDSLPLTAANLCNRAIELMLIMLPRPRGAMRRATAWPTRQTPVRLVSRTCAQSCSVISRKGAVAATPALLTRIWIGPSRTEEHTSELQSLMRTSNAVFCLKKKKNRHKQHDNSTINYNNTS